MKKILILLALITNMAFAQVKNGEPVTALKFKTILNAPVKSADLSQLKGKIVLIDFWATWCGSCIVAMPHLQALQKQYPKTLQVITVTGETAKRTALFLKNRPSNLWFAVDSGDVIAAMFPHQLIPHDILIDADGKLIGATDPEHVTTGLIDSLIKKQTVHLAEKVDNLTSFEDILKNYFHADDTVKNRLMIQPAIKGAPGVSTTYLDNPAFYGRRITALNLTPLAFYRLAYGNFPFSRIISQLPKNEKQPSYCLDIIVPEKTALLPTLQKELMNRFEIKAKTEWRDTTVYILKLTDAQKFKTIPVNTNGKRTYSARHGEIDQQNVSMADLASYLEDYATGRPVIDETGNNGKFDIKFSFQPEDKNSLIKVLADMGLSIEKQQRKVEMMVLYKPDY